jgi:antirestriction protein ArdC
MTGTDQHFDNSAAYLASWLRTIKGDPKLVVQAAAQAQHAVDHILGVTYQNGDES